MLSGGKVIVFLAGLFQYLAKNIFGEKICCQYPFSAILRPKRNNRSNDH